MKYSLVGSYNLSFLSDEITKLFNSYEYEFTCLDIPYGQYQSYVYDENSELRTSSLDYIIFINSLEGGVLNRNQFDKYYIESIYEIAREYIQLIEYSRENIEGIFFISNFVLVDYPFVSLLPNSDDNKLIQNIIHEINGSLVSAVEDLNDVYMLDLNSIANFNGLQHSTPGKYWYLTRAPFSKLLNIEIAKKIFSIWLNINEKTTRLVILDLDNTLWGGVIGDAGPEGIQLGGSYPGNIYQDIQKIFYSLMHKGIVLAVCSKNTESVVVDYFSSSEMILKLDDFVSFKVNWDQKSNNIVKIAKEVGIGFDNICFIDDSKFERDEVRLVLPSLIIPEMPDEISDWPKFIKDLPFFSFLSLNKEDLNKNEKYRIRKEINNALGNKTNRIDYLKSLDMELDIKHINKYSEQRIVQLFHKTNQFNMTGSVYTHKKISELDKQCVIFGISIKDRLGSDEIIGAIIVNFSLDSAIIENFILSCRVLGRDIEYAVLSTLCKYFNHDYLNIVGIVKETDRNIPARSVYKNYGFKKLKNGIYILPIKDCIHNSVDIFSRIDIS